MEVAGNEEAAADVCTSEKMENTVLNSSGQVRDAREFASASSSIAKASGSSLPRSECTVGKRAMPEPDERGRLPLEYWERTIGYHTWVPAIMSMHPAELGIERIFRTPEDPVPVEPDPELRGKMREYFKGKPMTPEVFMRLWAMKNFSKWNFTVEADKLVRADPRLLEKRRLCPKHQREKFIGRRCQARDRVLEERRARAGEVIQRPDRVVTVQSIEVQCSKCMLWRELHVNTDIAALPKPWSCQFSSFGDCDEKLPSEASMADSEANQSEESRKRPRESSADSTEPQNNGLKPVGNGRELKRDIVKCHSAGFSVNDQYPPGSLVMMRVEGLPPWPGLVEADPNHSTHFTLKVPKAQHGRGKNKKHANNLANSLNVEAYHVTLLGEPSQRVWLKVHNVARAPVAWNPFAASQHSVSIQEKYKCAIEMFYSAKTLSVDKRVEKFGYLARYLGRVKKEPNFDADVEMGPESIFETGYLPMSLDSVEEAKFDTSRYLPGDIYLPAIMRPPPMPDLLDETDVEAFSERAVIWLCPGFTKQLYSPEFRKYFFNLDYSKLQERRARSAKMKQSKDVAELLDGEGLKNGVLPNSECPSVLHDTEVTNVVDTENPEMSSQKSDEESCLYAHEL